MTAGHAARVRYALLVACALLVGSSSARAELPTDPARVADAPDLGLALSASMEVGVLARDVFAGGSLGLGVEQHAFALRLRAPLYLAVYDLPPAREEATPLCRYVRCTDWLETDGGQLRPEALSRLVEHLRIGRPGELVYARGGPLFATLGTGQLVDRLWNSPEYDRRQSGLYGQLSVPLAALSAELVVANLFDPARLVAARLQGRPLAPASLTIPLLGSFLSRLTLAAEGALDTSATAKVAGTARPVAAFATEVLWPLLDEGGIVSLTPFVGGSVVYGLSSDGLGGGAEQAAFGATLGARSELRLPFIALRGQGSLFVDDEGHRTGLFGTLYMLERREALHGASLSHGNIATVPAPGGLGFALRGEALVATWLRLGARYQRDTAVAGDLAEAFGELAVADVLVSTRVLQRGSLRQWPGNTLSHDTLVVAEAVWRCFGAVSVFARWYRTPRDVELGALRFDDDVMVGLRGDLLLSGADDGR
ncbi:MAG: hypothetical protein ACO3JL_08040 [Myxococcota bacterium]